MNHPIYFFEVLFDKDDYTCFSPNKYGTSVGAWVADVQFFSINPMHTSRLDANVTKYRNLLIEFDKVPLEEQLELCKTIPYSTLLFSGGKSYHAIISLETPLETESQYRVLAEKIYDKVPQADRTVKNPSRFSRAPNYMRDTGMRQTIIDVKTRVPTEHVFSWLGITIKDLEVQKKESIKNITMKFLPVRALAFVNYPPSPGCWNNALFIAATDMFSVGHSEDEVLEYLAGASGYLDKKDKSTIKSAKKNVQRET